MWVVLTALASCQNAAEDTGSAEAAPPDYPSLHTVPPRPELSYTVEQRRAIADGLIADRDNARYSNQVVRYRAGLSGLPPPAAPPAAAAPPGPLPEVPRVGSASAPPDPPPETEFDHYDDDLDTFLDDMAGEARRPPGGVAPGPASDAAPVGRAIVRAGAARPVAARAAPHDGAAPAAAWAIPAETAGSSPAASATASRAARSPVPHVATSLAGRAPGVVWGMVDMPDRPAGSAAGSGAQVVTARSEQEIAPGPAAATRSDAPDGDGRGLRPTATAVAGRAPGVVWGMVDMPDRPAAPAAAAAPLDQRQAAPVAPPAAPVPAPAPTTAHGEHEAAGAADRTAAAPTAIARAEDPDGRSPIGSPTHPAGIEVSDGLVAIALAPSAEGVGPLASIGFAPGSATLPPQAATHLELFLAAVTAPDARIRVVGEADSPALAIDRALAVGLALMRQGVPAHRLELTLAADGAADRVRLSPVAATP